MKLRDLFRRKTPEPPYRWHVERKLEQQVWRARQVEAAGGLSRWLDQQRMNQNAAMQHSGPEGLLMQAVPQEELKAMEQRQWISMQLGQRRGCWVVGSNTL